ncbi:hypothetical protein ACFVYE_20445 [Streptomyces sp. NPDC058239]|uniref:hypothetical protein n=1 Tax=unclassified Streptomyces TaxID=2593676 RepID=UPI00365517FD
MDGTELADAVESVRNQLIDAAGRAIGRPVSFEAGRIGHEDEGSTARFGRRAAQP